MATATEHRAKLRYGRIRETKWNPYMDVKLMCSCGVVEIFTMLPGNYISATFDYGTGNPARCPAAVATFRSLDPSASRECAESILGSGHDGEDGEEHG